MACKTTQPPDIALEQWMRGASFEEVGETLGVNACDVERMVKSALEQLSRGVRMDIEDRTS